MKPPKISSILVAKKDKSHRDEKCLTFRDIWVRTKAQKTISSDFGLVLRNYALWVNENDEIWSVAAFHEKNFTVPKLRFLAIPASLLDEVSTDTENWPIRAVTTSNQSISVILQTFRPFWVIFGLFRSFLAILANFGLKFKIVAE